MISWFTESALIPLIAGTFISLAFLGLAISFRDRVMLYIAIVVALLAGGTAVVESAIVTDREAVVEVVQALAVAVENNDMNTVLSYVSDKREDQKARIKNEMPKYSFRTCRIIGINDFSSSKTDSPQTAEVDFVVIATGSHQQTVGTVQERVVLYLEKASDGKWRLIDYEHSSPRQNLRL